MLRASPATGPSPRMAGAPGERSQLRRRRAGPRWPARRAATARRRPEATAVRERRPAWTCSARRGGHPPRMDAAGRAARRVPPSKRVARTPQRPDAWAAPAAASRRDRERPDARPRKASALARRSVVVSSVAPPRRRSRASTPTKNLSRPSLVGGRAWTECSSPSLEDRRLPDGRTDNAPTRVSIGATWPADVVESAAAPACVSIAAATAGARSG
jgi:hypothetical protein